MFNRGVFLMYFSRKMDYFNFLAQEMFESFHTFYLYLESWHKNVHKMDYF